MAEFIEESVDSTDEPEQEVEQESQAVETNEEENLPEKYKGKDYKEIVRMHQEAEKLIGRQGSEVGELRRIVDDFIKAQASDKQQAQPEVDEEDFFADPKKAVERAIESHPKIKQAEKMASDMAKAKALETLKSKHPDFGNVVSDPGFLNWIQASKVRTNCLFVLIVSMIMMLLTSCCLFTKTDSNQQRTLFQRKSRHDHSKLELLPQLFLRVQMRHLLRRFLGGKILFD